MYLSECALWIGARSLSLSERKFDIPKPSNGGADDGGSGKVWVGTAEEPTLPL